MRTIPEKESLTIEFKSDRSGYSDADLVDEIVGMANTQGGDLYLGVEDDGEITGVDKKRQDPVGLSQGKGGGPPPHLNKFLLRADAHR